MTRRKLRISIEEAARRLGLKSRGSIYRKIKSGELESVDGPNGSRWVDDQDLERRWASITRTRTDSPRPQALEDGEPDEPAKKGRELFKPRPRPQKPSPPLHRRITTELPDYNESRARSEFEKANLLELERKTKEGELLRRDEVERSWAEAVTIAKTKLLAVPTRARQRIPHLTLDEIEVLTQLVRESLEEIADGQ